MPDWLFHLGGIVLLVAGTMLAGWALLWDRSRGRRRCPECWYDMAGVPGLVCPECGKDAKREGRLLRTRRRSRWAGLAVLLAVAVPVVWSVPVARAQGWPAALPEFALLAALPWMEVPTYQDRTAAAAGTPMPVRRRLYHELIEERLKRNRLAGWERRWLIERCIRGDARHRVSTEVWRQKYTRPLHTLHRAVQHAQMRESEPERFPGTPPDLLLIDMGGAELRRIRQGLALSMIHTREHWPVGEPLMFTVVTQPFQTWAGGAERTVRVQSRLAASEPLEWTLTSGSTLVPHRAHEPHGGIARAPQRGVDFDVRIVETRYVNGQRREEQVILETVVRHPVVISGTSRDILEPVSCEATRGVLLDELQPVCHRRPSMWQEGEQEVLALLFGGGSERTLLQPLTATPGLTLGVRVELLRNGETVADGVTYWAAQSRATGAPYLVGAGYVGLHWGPGVVIHSVDDAEWTLRLTGDPVVALRNFEGTHFWEGAVEKPVVWQMPRP